jgi:hypothetical protein
VLWSDADNVPYVAAVDMRVLLGVWLSRNRSLPANLLKKHNQGGERLQQWYQREIARPCINSLSGEPDEILLLSRSM